MKRRAMAAVLFGTALTLTGCAPSSPPAPPPPPAPLAETMPLPPVSAVPLIWQPGYWDWTGSSYVWSPGQFVTRGGHGELWMPGFWERTPSGWIWSPAHWV
jgi:hypothetical protein